MKQSVQDLIGSCRAEMLAHPDHVLSFATRRELLRTLGPLIPDDCGSGREMHDAKKRRTELAWMCATKVANAWDRAFQSPAVRQLLQGVRGYLDNHIEVSVVERATDVLQGALYCDPQGKDEGYLAGRAACACAWVAIGDEMLYADAGISQSELDDPQDPDFWDPAFFAAAAYVVQLFNNVNYHVFAISLKARLLFKFPSFQ